MYYYLVPSHTTPGKKSVKIEIQPADNVSEYRLQLEEEQNTTWIAGNCFEITKNGNYHVEIKGIDQQVEQRSFTISFLGKRPAFDGGAGTQEDPFQISTLEQLNAIRLKLSGHYILTADIDLAQWGGLFGFLLGHMLLAERILFETGHLLEQLMVQDTDYLACAAAQFGRPLKKEWVLSRMTKLSPRDSLDAVLVLYSETYI